VTVLITNSTATLAAGPAAVTVFASADGVVDPSDLTIGTVTKGLKLKPGQSKPVKVKVQFPAPAADGDFQILASATFNGADGGLAAGASPVHVEQPRVDLAGLPGAGGGGVFSLGAKAKLSVPLVNRGNVPAKGSLNLDLLASTDGTTDPAASFVLATLPSVKAAVKPGATRNLKLKFALPPSFPAGFAATPGTAYFLLVRLSASTVGTPNQSDGRLLATVPFALG
jgi:hypothetical protein